MVDPFVVDLMTQYNLEPRSSPNTKFQLLPHYVIKKVGFRSSNLRDTNVVHMGFLFFFVSDCHKIYEGFHSLKDEFS
jgi:hypothetical protein